MFLVCASTYVATVLVMYKDIECFNNYSQTKFLTKEGWLAKTGSNNKVLLAHSLTCPLPSAHPHSSYVHVHMYVRISLYSVMELFIVPHSEVSKYNTRFACISSLFNTHVLFNISNYLCLHFAQISWSILITSSSL